MQALQLEVCELLVKEIFDNVSRLCLYQYPVPKGSLLLINEEQHGAKLTFTYCQAHSDAAEKNWCLCTWLSKTVKLLTAPGCLAAALG